MKKQFLLLLLTFSTLAILRGQPITVETLVAPPFAANISDYLDQNVLKITNSSNAPISIMLKGTLTSDIGINGRTKDAYKAFRPIVVPANNVPVILQATKQNRVDFFDTKNVDYNTGPYSLTDIIRTGVVPEGNYTVCITAHDFTTGELKSKTDNGFNCRTFNIVTPQPPTIDCDGNAPLLNGTESLAIGANIPEAARVKVPVSMNFSWIPTNVNGRNVLVAYDLYLLKLVPNQNGQDALLNAIRLKQNNPIKFENIRTPQYNAILATTPSLVAGKYAWAVVAKDGGGGQTVFQNGGISQVCEFEWTAPAPPPPNNGNVLPRLAITVPNCDCNLVPPVEAASTEDLKMGDFVKIGKYKLRVNTVQRDPAGGWKGTGNIALQILGVRAIPFLVDFEKLTFVKTGDNRQAKTGLATAQKHAGGPSFEPKIVTPDKPKLLDVKASDAMAYDNYFNRNKDKVLSNLEESAQNSGIQLPFGLDGQGLPTIAIINLTFTPEKSWFDAIAGMEISDEPSPNNWLAFGASGVCLKTDDTEGLCGDAQLYLAEDLNLTALNLKLFGAKGQDLKNACHLLIKESKVDSAYLLGEYSFSKNVLKRADNGPEDVKASMKFRARSWSKWYATVEMPDFKIAGAEDFKFEKTIATYDHTNMYNPAGIPADYTEGSLPQWQGFFLPKIKAQLPPLLKKNDDKPTDILVENFIIDKHGVSVRIVGNDVISIKDGNLDGWAFSLDNIDVKILKSTFVYGKMRGKMMLPLTKNNAQSELDYDGLLAYRNDSLKYTFNVKPKADLEVPIWAAKITLNANSNVKIGNENKEKKFHAEAHLYGNININTHDADLRLPNFNLVGMKFENLYLKNYKDDANPKDHYFGADTTYFTGAFASPPKSAGGFPLAMTKFKFSPQANANATLEIGFSLKISDLKVLPEANAELFIKANIAPVDGKLTPTFIGIVPTAVRLEGNVGPVNIKGSLAFYEGVATYGNGIYGRLSAKMLKGGETYKMDLGNVAAQFGTKDGRPYWFVDAMITRLDKLIPGAEIYALGGGASYNMTADKLPDLAALRTLASANGGAGVGAGALTLGVSVSGTKYTPSPTGKLAFKAATFFGIGKKEMFNANASLGVEFNMETGGLSRFQFDGSAHFLEATEGDPPLAGGDLKVDYDAEQEILSVAVFIKIKSPPVTQASLHLYFSPAGWNIKLGRPEAYDVNAPIVLDLLPGLVAKGYFEVGNYDLDAPKLPQFIIDQLKKAETKIPEFPTVRPNLAEVKLKTGGGIAFGASLGIDIGGDFGPIYGNLKVMAGFDMMIEKYTEGCNNQAVIGIDGYYAMGQIYAGLEAKLGLIIDLGFFSTRIKILEGGAAAVLQGGGPNPFWGQGAAGVYVDVLGLIKGTISCEFKVGTPCRPNNGDPLAGIKVISDMLPKDLTKEVEVDQFPTVAFNYGVGKLFTIDEFLPDNTTKTRTFQLRKTDIVATLKPTNGGAAVAVRLVFPSNDVNTMVIELENTLNPTIKDYTLTVETSMTEYVNFIPQVAKIKTKNGAMVPFKEIKTVNFSTNNGLQSVKYANVMNMSPIKAQRFFIRDDNPRGFIKMYVDNPLSSFDVPKGNNISTSLLVRFVKLDGLADRNSVETPVTIANKEWSFTVPSNLSPQQVYVAQFIIRWKDNTPNNTPPKYTKMATTNFVNVRSGFSYEVSEQKLNENKLKAGGNERVVFSIPFRTSRFKTFSEKLTAFKVREIVMSVANAVPEKVARIWFMSDQAYAVANVAQRTIAALNLPNNGTTKLFPREYNFWLDENFDDIDVKGTKINNYTDIPPLITFDNNSFKSWADNIYRSIETTLRTGGAGYMSNYISDWRGQIQQGVGIEVFVQPDIGTYPTPILSEFEQKGHLDPLSNDRDWIYLNPNSVWGDYYMSQGEELPLLTIKYGQTKPFYPPVTTINNIFGKINWGVNPASGGFNAMGNAFNAGMNAAGAQMGGMNMGANAGGKSLKMGR